MKTHLHRPSSRSVALGLLGIALLLAAAIAAAFTREADTEAARANSGLQPLVLIAGTAGDAERLIATRANEQGFAVRAPSGDLRDERTARESLRGAEFVVCGLAECSGHGPEAPELGGYRAFVNLLEASRAAGVRHFVLISPIPAGESVKAEEYLKASGLVYTIVSASELSDAPARASGLRVAARAAHRRPASVSRADLARIVIDALRNPNARNKSFAVFNDPGASPETWRKELYGIRRDSPAAETLESARSRTGARSDSREVVPTPQRERLMIDEEEVEDVSVEWSGTTASSR